MKWLILIVLISLPCFSKDIDQSACPNFDYSDRFGPVQDQDGHGLCWAFASSALLSEDACLRDKNNCGINISPLDVSSCRKTLLAKNEGRSISMGLQCAQSNGACFEKDFSFVTQGSALCGLSNTGPRCIHEKLRDLYKEYQALQITLENCQEEANAKKLNKFVDEFKDLLKRSISRTDVTDETVKALLLDPKIKDWSSFLYSALKNERCATDRIDYSHIDQSKLYNMTIIKDMKEKVPLEKKVELVKTMLQKGRSIGYTFCANESLPGLSGLLVSGSCGSHAVVINGMRWHKGECQLNIRNSWGKNGPLHGWISAKKILKHSTGLQQIETK
ncbi:C1 family peptidase [Peredibacter starrii]|uniref:C1 family peptidase n=1 Tax=Peredibacter starrii TaxID=28202 RepID=A0AAX4HJP6_9BACT|nr:C1 family peptidase [Peredibacter starrii]WPU63424.1 C1 family peptidase [Peredibacter starrii]